MHENILIWLLIIPLVFSMVFFAVRATGTRSLKLLEVMHVSGIVLLLLASIWLVWIVIMRGHIFALSGLLYADKLTAIFILVIGVMGFLNGLYSIGYMRHELEAGVADEKALYRYYGFYHLFLFTMIMAVLPNNIVLMWVGIEATTLGSAFLVGFYGHKLSLEATWKYVLICSIGVGFALFGTILVYAGAFNAIDNANASMLWSEIMKSARHIDAAIMKLALVFLFLGYGTKAGFFPMHSWLPDAHSEAPSPVSSLLSGVLLNCALYALVRYYMVASRCLGPTYPRLLFLVFGVVSVACAAFFIYGQRDLKRMLAYSSIENIGLIATGLGIGGVLGVLASLFHLINHSIAKSLLFCTSGNVLIKYGTRDLGEIRGLFRVAPYSAFLLGAGALAISGCPPFSIFISEMLTVAAGLRRGYLWLMVFILLLLVIVFAAFLRLIGESVFGAPQRSVRAGDVPWSALVPVFLLLALVLGLGICIPSPLYQLLKDAACLVNYGI